MAERERLRGLVLEALAKPAAHQQRGGADRDGALRTALRLIALDPLQEPGFIAPPCASTASWAAGAPPSSSTRCASEF